MECAHSNRDFAAHQPRQQQVAGGVELLVLQAQSVRLRKQRLGLFIEGTHKRAPRHENLGPLKVTGNDGWICRPASVVLQITDERICRSGLKQKRRW